jgi:hypothetical protein
MSRSVRIVLGIVVGLVLVLGIGGAFVWWKITGLKEQLVKDLQNAIGAQVQIASIDLDLWKGELHAAGISLTNQRASAPWDTGNISQATVRFHLSDVFAPTMPVSVEVTSWNVVLHKPDTGSDTANSAAPADVTPPPPPGKGRVQVTELTAQDGSVEIDLAADRKIMIRGVSFQSGDNGGGVWTTQLQANSVVAGSLQAGASSAKIRGDKDKITFTDLVMKCEPGAVTGEGEIALGGAHDAKINLKAMDVPMSMLVSVAWQMKLLGLASGELHYVGNDQGGGAKGQIVVNHAKFNVLPWLGKVTAMTGLPDISNVELDKATSDFDWKDNTFNLTNLDVRKEGVTRFAGQVAIDAIGQVDGHIQLGLPSTVTNKWPQLQTQVFSAQRDDYNWADVHITGTPDNLQEDLMPRLVAVGIGQGGDLINQGAQKATELFNSFIGK